MFMRLLRETGGSPDETGTPFVFAAATPGKKRDGKDTGQLPWRTDRYQENPVVTWVHDFEGARLPIGRADVEIVGQPEGERVRAAVLFDEADPFAAEVARKYRDGFLHAVSVSWDDVDEDGIPVRVSGKKAVAHDLLEIAAVPVPGDPAALAEREMTALRALRDDLDAIIEDPDGEGEDADVQEGPQAAEPTGATPGAHPRDAEMQTAAASAMLAAFDRDGRTPDEERRQRYNWACVMYRWLGRTPPEWLDGEELRALDDVRAEGGRLNTIGLGADVDAVTLRSIAGADERYYFTPASPDLARIHGEIARDRACPGNVLWEVGDDSAGTGGRTRRSVALAVPGTFQGPGRRAHDP